MQHFDINNNDIEKIKQALEEGSHSLQHALSKYHPTEIAKLFETLSEEKQKKLLQILPAELASEVLSEIGSEYNPEELLKNLNPEKRTAIIEELDYDDATDLISQLTEQEQENILKDINPKDAHEIRSLLSYEEDTAGGIMNTLVIKVYKELSKKEALDEIIRQSEEIEEYYSAYVIDEEKKLFGWISLSKLIKSNPLSKISDICEKDFIYVTADTHQEEVAKLLSQYNLISIPVVDEKMKLIGKITFDDVIDVLEEENTKDILKFSGVSEDEKLGGSWIGAIQSRLPWLILNLFTAFLASSVIRYFDDTISNLVILSSYMTIIAGMGGNSGTQCLAVTIRRIALSNLTLKQEYKTVLKELLVGLTNGLILGLLVSIFSAWRDNNPKLGLVIFLSLMGNIIISAFAGSSIPLLLKKIGIDPAVASSIMITACTDIFGFLLLLGLASKILL